MLRIAMDLHLQQVLLTGDDHRQIEAPEPLLLLGLLRERGILMKPQPCQRRLRPAEQHLSCLFGILRHICRR